MNNDLPAEEDASYRTASSEPAAACPRSESENFFRLVLEAAPSAILVIDHLRRIVFANRAAENLFGYNSNEIVGEPMEKLVPERSGLRLAAYIDGLAQGVGARAIRAGREIITRRKNGSEIPIEISLSSIETPTGRLIVASMIDRSERRRAEERFRLFVEASPLAKLIVDSFGCITLINHKTEELFGYKRSELIGCQVETLIPERFREKHPGFVRDFLVSPTPRPMGAGRELYGRKKDGSEVPIEIGLSPIEMPEGPCTLAAIIDISERKRRIAEVHQANAELQRSNAELEQFAYVASHDLQEPLRMVANYTQLLAERYQGKLDEKADKFIFYASDGARRMQRLVADLLSFSRVGSQGKALVAVSSEAVLLSVLQSLQPLILETGARIEHERLPEVMADEVQLRQLFQNLIGNAIKFRSEIPPKIVVNAAPSGAQFQFSVADNGIGLEMQYAERIFLMFQRLHELGKFDGSGIGLAISKRIVERHGGRIWVESQPGVGTTFFFTLRAAARKEEHEIAARASG